MVSAGIHVAIEGLDGSGKSTLIDRLCAKLAGEFETREFRLPDVQAIAGRDLVDMISRRTQPSSPGVLALAFAANRLDSFEKQVAPYLADGSRRIALSHRYVLSGLAYQSSQGVDLARLFEINSTVPAPAVTIFLDTDPATCEKRIAERQGQVELFEEEFGQMRKYFICAIDLLRDSGWNIVVLDGSADADELASVAVAHVRQAASL